MFRIFKKQIRQVQQFVRIARFCHRTTPFWKLNYPKVLLLAVRLCCKEKFQPFEAYRLGLYKPGLFTNGSPSYASKAKWTKLQLTVNPRSWLFLIRDKSIFYRYCMACGIPVPNLYAVFFRTNHGWSPDGTTLRNRKDWERLLKSELPGEFIIKPATGSYSRDVNLFRKIGGTFIDAVGERHKAGDIYDMMLSHPKYDGFVIQERLKNHPDLIRLSGTESLQTVRIISFIDGTRRCRILHAHFKPIIGPHLVDTFIDGLTGNIEAAVCLENGRLKSANQITATGSGTKTLETHPETGVCLNGFQLPLWPQARRLVTETAQKFLPLRTIGWDVALTPDAPVILEGNGLWDPPNQHRCIDTLLSEMFGKSPRELCKGDI